MIYQKPLSIIPPSDKARLGKLYEYQILDTPAEETFDKIAKLAAQVFDTPSAFVTFVDEARVYFKANLSPLKGNEVLRKDSLCSLAILENHTTVFNDTHQSPDLLESPHVSCEAGIRFYAGAPLKTPEGHQLGTVCVVDIVPREATEKQLKMLETLSSMVIDELENRMKAQKAVRAQVDLMNIVVHELKNPVSSIQLANDIIKDSDSKNELSDVSYIIDRSTSAINTKLNDLLVLSRMEDFSFELQLSKVNLVEILKEVRDNFELLAQQKNQCLQLEYPNDFPLLHIDMLRIKDVFQNLLSNAIKFSHKNTKIQVVLTKEKDSALIEFRDQGQGLSDKDMDKLFVKFAKLSAIPTGKESSSGLGLSICKTLIELHHGKIWAISPGKNEGTSFFVSLPLNELVREVSSGNDIYTEA